MQYRSTCTGTYLYLGIGRKIDAPRAQLHNFELTHSDIAQDVYTARPAYVLVRQLNTPRCASVWSFFYCLLHAHIWQEQSKLERARGTSSCIGALSAHSVNRASQHRAWDCHVCMEAMQQWKKRRVARHERLPISRVCHRLRTPNNAVVGR